MGGGGRQGGMRLVMEGEWEDRVCKKMEEVSSKLIEGCRK